MDLIAENFISYLGFSCNFIYRSGGTCKNPVNPNIEGYLLTKHVIFLTVCLLLYILMLSKGFISKSVSAGKIQMPFYL